MFGRSRAKIPAKPGYAPRDTYGRRSSGGEQFDVNLDAARRLGWDCRHDATLLTWILNGKFKLRKSINIAAGVMAILSSGAIASVAGDYLTSASMKWVAALGALILGLISLANNMLEQKDVLTRMMDASCALDALNSDVEAKLREPEVIELNTALRDQLDRSSGQFPNLTDEEQKALQARFASEAAKLHRFTSTITEKRAALIKQFKEIIEQAIDANRVDYERNNVLRPSPVVGPKY
jgi:hypothetical protein